MADLTTPVADVVEQTNFKSLAVIAKSDNGGKDDAISVAMTEDTETIGPVVDELLSYGFTPRFWAAAADEIQFVRG